MNCFNRACRIVDKLNDHLNTLLTKEISSSTKNVVIYSLKDFFWSDTCLVELSKDNFLSRDEFFAHFLDISQKDLAVYKLYWSEGWQIIGEFKRLGDKIEIQIQEEMGRDRDILIRNTQNVYSSRRLCVYEKKEVWSYGSEG